MKVSSSGITGHPLTAYNNSGEFTTLPITTSGDQIISVYMTPYTTTAQGMRKL